jgi:RimJ/RimL family protein N-acetyltransferase
MPAIRLLTPRLELIAFTPALAQAELAGSPTLSAALDAVVPASWPPPLNDPETFRFVADRLSEDPAAAGWWFWYVALRGQGPRLLAGTAGFKGRPTADGTVEIGYSVLPEHQRRGIATEACRALLDWAFGWPQVQRVVADTFPDLLPSLGVMRKLDMQPLGPGPEEGTLRQGIERQAYLRQRDGGEAG